MSCRREFSGAEEPGEPNHKSDVVCAEVWLMNSCAGDVQEPDITRERQIFAQKIMHTNGRLQIEFESTAEVRRANAGGRNSRAQVEKWNPTRACSEIVAQMRRQAYDPFAIRRILSAAPQLHPPSKLPRYQCP